ncbi:type II toxin-antitoxin system CcdA family antitoxin [Microbulbifer halophilus]|uniref:Type II toxin-antitoxin system CcdA family antitoxin n=1 Tax=Microbulbifer halophilus TaxID=453963 RepID=A0ABW5EFW6_9GAMM
MKRLPSRSCRDHSSPSTNPELSTKGVQWLRENRQALEALNRFADINGLFSQRLRIQLGTQPPE